MALALSVPRPALEQPWPGVRRTQPRLAAPPEHRLAVPALALPWLVVGQPLLAVLPTGARCSRLLLGCGLFLGAPQRLVGLQARCAAAGGRHPAL